MDSNVRNSNDEKSRTVSEIIEGTDMDLGGMPIKQPLPSASLDQVSPFLLLHHLGPYNITPESGNGVAPHPHRGFEPVTFLYDGHMEHKDSRGNHSVLGPGGVQWMTSGMGIIHSEYPEKDFVSSGGKLQLIQLWVNLPKKYKMVQPRYQNVEAGDIPTVEQGEGNVKIKVVTGEYKNIKGPIATYTPILSLNTEIKKGSGTFIPVPENFNACIYVVEGSCSIGGSGQIQSGKLVVLNNDGEGIEIKAAEDSKLLILAGEPINEPVKRSGPYVMNTTSEIMEAIRDYQMGKMGIMTEW